MAEAMAGTEGVAVGKAKPDINEMIARMLVGLLINYIAKRIRNRRSKQKDTLKARKKMGKLAAKGKDIPAELKETATGDLGFCKKRKLNKKMRNKMRKVMKKKAKKQEKGKKGHKGLLLLLIIGIAVAVMASRAKK